MRWVYAAMGIVTVGAGISAEGTILRFLSLSGLSMALGGSVLLGQLVSQPVTSLLRPMPSRYLRIRIQMRERLAGLRSLQEAVRHLGGFIVLLSGVGICRQLDDPSRLGPLMAFGLLGLLYSQFLSEGLLGTRATLLQARLAPTPSPVKIGGMVGLPLLGGMTLLGVGVAHDASMLSALISLPSMLYVLLLGVFLSLAVHTRGELNGAFNAALHPEFVSLASNTRHIAVLTTVRTAFALAGSSGMLIAYVDLLGHLGDPRQFPLSVGTAMLAWCYGFFISEVLCRLLVRRLAGTSEVEPQTSMMPMLTSIVYAGFVTAAVFLSLLLMPA